MDWESKLLLGEDRLTKLQEPYIKIDPSEVEKIIGKIYRSFDYFKVTSKDQKDTLEFCNHLILLMVQKVDEENQNISIYSKKRLYLNSINTILNSSFVNQSTLNSLISEMLEGVNSCIEEFKLAFEISEDIKYDLCASSYYDPRTPSITLKIGRNTLFYIYCALNKEAFIDKKFLKEVYGYFEDQSKGKYDYKNWFQSKTPSLNESLLSLI